MVGSKRITLPMLDSASKAYRAKHGYDMCGFVLDVGAYPFNKYLSSENSGTVFSAGLNPPMDHKTLVKLVEISKPPICFKKDSRFYLKQCGKELDRECGLYSESVDHVYAPIDIEAVLENSVSLAMIGTPVNNITPSRSAAVMGSGIERDGILKSNLTEYYKWMAEERAKEINK